MSIAVIGAVFVDIKGFPFDHYPVWVVCAS